MSNESPPATIIARLHNGVQIPQRVSDRYINVTKMCQANGKRWNNYTRMKSTQQFLEALSDQTRISVSGLVYTGTGGWHGTDTWAHPHVAINCAMWINPMFAVQVTQWVHELLTEGTVSIGPANPEVYRPWSARLEPAFRRHKQYILSHFHPGCFSMVTATITEVFVMEDELLQHFLPLTVKDLPDGSVGQHWALHRQRNGLQDQASAPRSRIDTPRWTSRSRSTTSASGKPSRSGCRANTSRHMCPRISGTSSTGSARTSLAITLSAFRVRLTASAERSPTGAPNCPKLSCS